MFWHLHYLILLQWVLSEFLQIKLVGWMGSSWVSELSAQILLSALPSVFPLSLQHHVLLSQKCWSKKTFFYFCLCCTCKEILCLLGIFLAYFHFDSVCDWVCVVCAVVLFWTLPYCLRSLSLYFFFVFFLFYNILDTFSCKILVICDKDHSVR